MPKGLVKYPKRKKHVTGRTVGDLLAAVFPLGPIPEADNEGFYREPSEKSIEWSYPPASAPDLFAACSHLLELSGAFSFFSASIRRPHKKHPVRLWLSPRDLKKAIQVGQDWSDYPFDDDPPILISDGWTELVEYWDWPINAKAYQATKTRPKWWKIAYFLFISADEAAKLVGFPSANANKPKKDTSFSKYFEVRQAALVEEALGASETRLFKNPFASMCHVADPDVICVQPKALISTVGGGARVFSHYLAALRPRGIVKTQWASATLPSHSDEASKGLNLLLVPIPFKLRAENFRPYGKTPQGTPGFASSWRTFKVRQSWLNEYDPATEILKLIKKSRALGHEIHGIVLPELALNTVTYERLAELIGEKTTVEFIVSGCSKDCYGVDGNYVWCSRYKRNTKPSKKQYSIDFIQSKHHRWKMDGKQVKTYKLDKYLKTGFDWWEHINVGGRELNFAPFRSSSVFATLVCEDLARSEPCHEILRSVGPNLLFALLMDGPQIEPRWPARYASYLSEDPGIAVLTMTSKGLIELSNPDDTIHSIAHFRDANGNKCDISCPDESDAVLLRLHPEPKTISSIDGRSKQIVNWLLNETDPIIPL